MNYYQITVHTVSAAVEALSNEFLELSCGGVEIFDPQDILSQEANSLNWDYMDEDFLRQLQRVDEAGEVLMRCYFSEEVLPNQTALEDLLLKLGETLKRISEFLPTGSGFIETNLMAEESWANAWKKYYKPFRLGKRIHIVPSWLEEEGLEGDINISMDPGMAFGSGTHETTSMCIMALEEAVQDGMTVLDIGCGSGILGIVSAKLGAKPVIGTDLDPNAVLVARENAANNGVNDSLSIYHGDLVEIPQLEGVKADIVVANIMADIIMHLSPMAKQLLKQGGRFICSGIILEREQEVKDALANDGFTLAAVHEKGSWVCMEFINA